MNTESKQTAGLRVSLQESRESPSMSSAIKGRREFLKAGLTVGIGGVLAPAVVSGAELSATVLASFELEETTIAELQVSLKSGRFTARSLAEKYLDRIEKVDKHGPAINSVIEVNPDALQMADALDNELKQKGPRGPLHGIPILVKDNIDTADRMMTTAGSLAMVGARPVKDAFLVQRLRASGAVILGKTNPSEWANIRSSHWTSGWSGRGGLTRNRYSLDRNPCGSSSGSGAAVSANLCAGAVGTETDGSIVCPSSANGIVGIKPTVGLISRSGVVGRFWHERLTIQPSVGFYNVFNFANFDSPGNALSGLVGLAANGPASASSISGASTAPGAPPRSDRIGVGSGLFQFGQPRVIEWGLKFTF